MALDRTARALEKQASWNQGYCPWDIANASLRRWLLVEIGLDTLLTKLREGWQWCQYDLKPYADRARTLAPQIKVALHFTIRESMYDTQIINQLLSQLGIKLTKHWSRAVPGHTGEKLGLYRLDQEHWHQMAAVLARRAAKRERLQSKATAATVGSPAPLNVFPPTGDPSLKLDDCLTPETLTDVHSLMESAAYAPAVGAALPLAIPAFMLQPLGVVP